MIKTNVIEFKTKKNDPFINVQFNSQNLPFLGSTNFLGVEIDAELYIWQNYF